MTGGNHAALAKKPLLPWSSAADVFTHIMF
jgi:hypothetical protein